MRDQRLQLEFESSSFQLYLLDPLAKNDPKDCFVLTIRDCRSWLRSIFNHALDHLRPHHRRRYLSFRYRPDRFSYHTGEKALVARGLFPLDVYLSTFNKYWTPCRMNICLSFGPVDIDVNKGPLTQFYETKNRTWWAVKELNLCPAD